MLHNHSKTLQKKKKKNVTILYFDMFVMFRGLNRYQTCHAESRGHKMLIKERGHKSGAAIFQSALYKHHIDSMKCMNEQIQNINVKSGSATLKLHFKAKKKSLRG